MCVQAGVDEFGREHFVVEAPRGRLGFSFGENERGFVIVRGVDLLTPSEMDAWDEIDRRRVNLMRQSVEVGDRIVAIEGQDVVHCSLQEVISRLGKLSAIARRLTFARYHASAFDAKKYDVEKLVHTRVPSGPLGLQIVECIPFGAFVEDFQALPDGSMTKLAIHPQIHRGCQIVNVNGVDVSSSSREEVISLLSSLKDQEKEVVFYRTTGNNCSAIYSVDASVSERHLGFTIDENESMRCVITSVGPRGHPSIGLGDVLIGVNMVDITSMPRKAAIALVKDMPLPRQLYFARHSDDDLPECHLVRMGAGSLGVNVDSEQRDSARITGFTSASDAERPEFKDCQRFVPGSYFITVGLFDITNHDLGAVSMLLGKLKQTTKDIVIGNKPLLEILRKDSPHVKVSVPAGPLGVNFNGAYTECASVAGFYRSPTDGSLGAIESSRRVPHGAVLERVNSLNVSCLTLQEVTDLLRKLSDSPKEMTFHVADSHHDTNTRTVDVRLSPGPLGIDLKSSIANRVVVDKLNDDPSRGSTRVFDHGGVVQGSEIVAIDGFDVSKLELSDVLQLLKTLSGHEKVITFSTTKAAYDQMLEPAKREGLVRVDCPGSTSLPLDTGVLERALLASSMQLDAMIPTGSRLVGIDHVNVRSLSLQHVVATLQCLANAPTISLVFDTTCAGRRGSAGSPTKPWLAQAVSSVLASQQSSPPKLAVVVENLRGSGSLTNLHREDQEIVRPSLSTPNFQSMGAGSGPSPPPSPSRASNLAVGVSGGVQPVSPPSPRGGQLQASGSPPAPAALTSSASLSRLSIRTMEASNSDQTKITSEKKQQQQGAQPDESKSEFLINMASWTGSRSLYRLEIDVATNSIHISPVKATSPRPGKSSSFTTVGFHEIISMNCGALDGKPALFRSSSSTLNTDGTERAAVSLTTTGGKKTIDFDMRSTDERAAFATRMKSLVSALASPFSS